MIKIDYSLVSESDILLVGDYRTHFYYEWSRKAKKAGKLIKLHPHHFARSVIILRDGTVALSTYTVRRLAKLLAIMLR